MYLKQLVQFAIFSISVTACALIWPSTALAVPSFARQTGMSCAACHTVPPQLNAFGRYFKLHGYTLGAEKLSGGNDKLSIDKFPPLSAMAIMSDTVTKTAQPDSQVANSNAQNGTVAFPQQLSLFYAGAVGTYMGVFSQITYAQPDDHLSMDNTDVRYARDTTWGNSPVVWGFTLNNNPTVQDVWNSTPAWGFPFISSESAPSPSASPILAGTFGQQVAGLGAYAWWNNSIYGELTLYRTSQVGSPQPFDSSSADVISGVAPYWRLAWEHPWAGNGGGQHDLEVGLLGMSAHLYPGGGSALSGSTNNFTDTGVDAQYQYFTGNDSLTVHGIFLHEKQDWNAASQAGAANPSDSLNYWKADASYYWNNGYGPTLAYFRTTGSTDPLLYAPGAVSGSLTGSPNSSGWILQWTWVPDLNVQISAQYIIYNKFNGASSNYDGAGRNASDNNTLYLAAWLLW
jgi:hypothetical protein